jgi:hypothetical protein
LQLCPAIGALLAARGARRAWLFGSLAWGRGYEPSSDIDIAVEGIPPDRTSPFPPPLRVRLRAVPGPLQGAAARQPELMRGTVAEVRAFLEALVQTRDG